MFAGLILLQGSLSLGPVSLSYPELAQALTRAGMACEASPSLRDRGAFVCLRNRTPGAVRRLLGEALGVAFRPDDKGWRMVVDPDAKERERLLVAAYRRQAMERTREWAADREKIRAGRNYVSFERWTTECLDRLRTVADVPEGLDRSQNEVTAAVSAMSLLQPAYWCALRDARSAGVVSEAVARPYERPATIVAPAGAYGLPDDVLRTPSLPEVGPATTVSTRWSFRPETGSFTMRAHILFDRGSAVALFEPRPFTISVGGLRLSSMGGDVEIPAEGATLEETFRRMGPDYQAYLARLASPTPAPALPEVESGPRSLSQILERLGEKGLEAAMELSPRFERLPGGETGTKTSLRRALAELPKPAAPRAGLEKTMPSWLLSVVYPPSSTGDPRRRYPWRAAFRDGVWLLVDPLAFLDHLQGISPIPYLQAERVLKKELGEGAPTEFTFAAKPVRWRLIEELSMIEGSELDALRAEGYRDVWTASFAHLLPVARLLATLPAAERAAAWKAARSSPKGILLATPRGTLILQVQAMPLFSDQPPVAQVVGYWQEGGQTVKTSSGIVAGEGVLD